ncbi:MAG: hypothetical protein DSZ22_03210 [Thaumarchaeota archaeon]|nr:MAG: hypothetical protein COB95_04565 [Nitrosopumilales archaeon]RTZ69986.1 MAG: hypothetical protein DSZ22_03210 [Nitrososphaerota archaeon]
MIIMVHNEHNKPKRSGSLLLIILGAILFMIGPTQYQNSPELGILALVSGFILGGIGFYLKYVKGKIIR